MIRNVKGKSICNSASVALKGTDSMFDNNALKEIVAAYKKAFGQVRYEEGYKWKSVKIFQDCWDERAEDFPSMLKSVLKTATNMLDSRSRFPKRMICKMAEKEPEAVRAMFIALYDESRPVIERIGHFIGCAEKLRDKYDTGDWRTHYQSSNAVSVYLFFRYPTRYYIYMYTKSEKFAAMISYSDPPIRGEIESVQRYFSMCDEVLQTIKQDDELVDMVKTSLGSEDYPDDDLHVLTDNIVLFGSRLEDEKPTDISCGQWLKMLKNPDVIRLTEIDVLRKWLSFDGEATCTEVGARYQEHPSSYIAPVVAMARRVQAHTKCNCRSRDDSGTPVWWEIPFTGTYTDSEHFQWTIRPELQKALTSAGISKLEPPQVSSSGEQNSPVNPPSRQCEAYTKGDFLGEVYLLEKDYDSLTSLLKHKKNIILQGAPGVGKTFAAKRLAYAMLGQKDEDKIKTIQFHQSYSYEEFVMGYKPDEAGGFRLTKGVFYQFCKQAENNPDADFFLIIDEINRGNLSKIFGELLMMIEKDYRGDKMTMAYDGLAFSVPSNLYVIGMMNTADRSLAMIDYALRRRFSFFDMKPAFDSEGFKDYQRSLENTQFDELINVVARLNQDIVKDDSLGDGFCIGHSYFCGQKKETCAEEWIAEVIGYDLIPTIREYWFDNKSKTAEWEKTLSGVLHD